MSDTGAGSGKTAGELILAGIERREALARAALAPDKSWPFANTPVRRVSAKQWPGEVRGALGGPWGEHCAANDPVHVLAVLAAAREELADAVAQQERHPEDVTMPGYCRCELALEDCGDTQQAARTLARLVTLYGGDA